MPLGNTTLHKSSRQSTFLDFQPEVFAPSTVCRNMESKKGACTAHQNRDAISVCSGGADAHLLLCSLIATLQSVCGGQPDENRLCESWASIHVGHALAMRGHPGLETRPLNSETILIRKLKTTWNPRIQKLPGKKAWRVGGMGAIPNLVAQTSCVNFQNMASWLSESEWVRFNLMLRSQHTGSRHSSQECFSTAHAKGIPVKSVKHFLS